MPNICCMTAGLVAGFLFFACGTARSEMPFDAGPFMINLPDRYTLAPQKNEAVFQFTGDGPQIMVVYYPQREDLPAIFEELLATVGASIADLKPAGDLSRMEVNAHPAFLGTYQGVVQANGATVQIYNLIGVLLFEKKGSLAFFSSYPEPLRSRWAPQLKEAFYSLRDIGEMITGMRNKKPARLGTSPN